MSLSFTFSGKGYQHKDKDFKELLAKTGGARYAPPLVERKKQFSISTNVSLVEKSSSENDELIRHDMSAENVMGVCPASEKNKSNDSGLCYLDKDQ